MDACPSSGGLSEDAVANVAFDNGGNVGKDYLLVATLGALNPEKTASGLGN